MPGTLQACSWPGEALPLQCWWLTSRQAGRWLLLMLWWCVWYPPAVYQQASCDWVESGVATQPCVPRKGARAWASSCKRRLARVTVQQVSKCVARRIADDW